MLCILVSSLCGSCANRSVGGVDAGGFDSQGRVVASVGRGRPVLVAALGLQGTQRVIAYAFSTGAQSVYGEKVVAAVARFTSQGVLDTSFGVDGMQLLELDARDFPDSYQNHPIRMRLLDDGRILVAGTTLDGIGPNGDPLSNLVCYRLTPDGALDPTFGTNGQVVVNLGLRNETRGLALQADGKIVIAGTSWAAATRPSALVLVRLGSDGQLDTTFGTGGFFSFAAGETEGLDLLVDTIEGAECALVGGTANNGLVFRRFLLDPPQIDQSFGASGAFTVTTTSWSAFSAMLLQPDGKLVALGTQDPWIPILVRLTSAGTLDTSFQGGIVSSPATPTNTFWGPLSQTSDGSIIGAAGGDVGGFYVAVWTTDGTLATGNATVLGNTADFGVLQAPPLVGGANLEVTAMSLEPLSGAGSLLVVGGTEMLNFAGNALLLEVNSVASTVDVDWSGDSPRGTGESVARASAIDAQGNIVVVGSAVNGRSRDLLVARLSPEGTLDLSFGDRGVTFFDGEDFGSDEGYALSVLPDGRIVAAGCTSDLNASPVATVIRFDAQGGLDTGFGDGGKAVVAAPGSDACAQSMTLNSDGSVSIAGYAGQPAFPPYSPASYVPLVAQFGSDGAPADAFNAATASPLITGVVSKAHALAMLNDGTLVAAGEDGDGGVSWGFASDGTRRWFSGVSSGPMDTLLAAQPTTGGVVVAGGSTEGATTRVLLARVQADGSLDTTFGGASSGNEIIDLGNNLLASGLAIDQGGRLVVAARQEPAQGTPSFVVALFEPNGALDSSFADGGTASMSFGYGPAYAVGVMVSDGGTYVTGSATTDAGIAAIAIWRLP